MNVRFPLDSNSTSPLYGTEYLCKHICKHIPLSIYTHVKMQIEFFMLRSSEWSHLHTQMPALIEWRNFAIITKNFYPFYFMAAIAKIPFDIPTSSFPHSRIAISISCFISSQQIFCRSNFPSAQVLMLLMHKTRK